MTHDTHAALYIYIYILLCTCIFVYARNSSVTSALLKQKNKNRRRILPLFDWFCVVLFSVPGALVPNLLAYLDDVASILVLSCLNPGSTAVPFWAQATRIICNLSPNGTAVLKGLTISDHLLGGRHLSRMRDQDGHWVYWFIRV